MQPLRPVASWPTASGTATSRLPIEPISRNLSRAKTGISQADAEKRVNDTIASAKDAETKARETADAARKATANFAIFAALSLLIGAFVASAAAAFGGSVRDEDLICYKRGSSEVLCC